MRAALAPGDDLAALARATPAGETLTLLVAPGRDPLSLALAKAALGPLAVERAPARLNAVLAAAGADPADVEAAAAWLDRAASTTGQWIEVGARHESRSTPSASPGGGARRREGG